MFEIEPRQGLVVWVYSMKQIKNLRRFGLVYYASRKMKYVLLYTNVSQVEALTAKIAKLHFVRKVEVSMRPELDMDFGGRVGKVDEEKAQSEDLNAEFEVPTIKISDLDKPQKSAEETK